VLYVRIAAGDVAARARIRNAAVELFGRDGFTVGLRSIAEAAGVSLGLIRHHFGSKDGLRQACDEYVMDHMRELQAEQVDTSDPASTLMDRMSTTIVEDARPSVRYLMRVLRSGDGLARDLIDRLTTSSEEYLRIAEENGLVRSSIDPAARARYLVMASIGAMVLEYAIGGDADEAYDRYVESFTLPALELYAQGLLVDRALLDEYLRRVDDAAGESGET